MKSSLQSIVESAQEVELPKKKLQIPSSEIEALVQKIQFSDTLTPAEKLEFVQELYSGIDRIEQGAVPGEYQEEVEDEVDEVREDKYEEKQETVLDEPGQKHDTIPNEKKEENAEDSTSLDMAQKNVLDEVAYFLASNDQNSIYLLSLFKKLQEVDKMGLR